MLRKSAATHPNKQTCQLGKQLLPEGRVMVAFKKNESLFYLCRMAMWKYPEIPFVSLTYVRNG